MLSKSITALLVVLGLGLVVHAGVASADPRSYYRSLIDVIPQMSDFPTVIAVPVPADAENVLVYEKGSGDFVASWIEKQTVSSDVVYTARSLNGSDGVRGEAGLLFDTDYSTAVELIVKPGTAYAMAEAVVASNVPRRVSEIRMNYATNSSLPRTVTVYAVSSLGEELVARVVAGGNMSRIVFPERYGQTWRITFDYDQPVRLQDISFGPTETRVATDAVRFLAQPHQVYTVYLYPEQTANVSLRESGDLTQVDSAVFDMVSPVKKNELYQPLDSDEDGVSDTRDNCPYHANPDQQNSRGQERGDVCDDYDNDGVINSLDNCPVIPNYAQTDVDADSVGDECDKSESRLTEQYPWLPWVGIFITLMVIGGLFVSVSRQPVPKLVEKTELESETEA